MNDGFIPAPIAVTQAEGLQFAAESETFLPVFASISQKIIPEKVHKKFPKGLPYDICCPSQANNLVSRVYTCGRYFATQSEKKRHQAEMRCSAQSGVFNCQQKRIQPKSIAAVRQKELLCVLQADHGEEMEWLDENDVHTENLRVPRKKVNVTYGTPVMTIESRTPAFSVS